MDIHFYGEGILNVKWHGGGCLTAIRYRALIVLYLFIYCFDKLTVHVNTHQNSSKSFWFFLVLHLNSSFKDPRNVTVSARKSTDILAEVHLDHLN
jgi:hypothetical protein